MAFGDDGALAFGDDGALASGDDGKDWDWECLLLEGGVVALAAAARAVPPLFLRFGCCCCFCGVTGRLEVVLLVSTLWLATANGAACCWRILAVESTARRRAAIVSAQT